MKDVVKQTIELDATFTRLQMVTRYSNSEMEKMRGNYIALAKEMRVPLSTVTDAAEAWLRTGMSATEANDALRASIILSTDAFMDGAQATQILVAAQKAYGLEANELISVVDKLTALDTKAATTAEDLGDALALSASSAGLAGISMDKYLAILATTSETTQQTAQTIGNSWKTILARLQQVKLGAAMDEEGGDISNVDKLLKEYNIDLMKETDNLENMEALLDILGERWKNYTAAQKSEIATIVAGTRQRDKLIATLNNYNRVLELTTISEESAGESAYKFGIYVESTQAKIDEFKTSWTNLINTTMESSWIKDIVDKGTKIVDFGEKLGGLIPIITELISVFGATKAIRAGLGAATSLGGVFGGIGGILGIVTSVIAFGYMVGEYMDAVNYEKALELYQSTVDMVEKSEQERKEISSLMSEYATLNAIRDRTEAQNKRLIELSQELSSTLKVEKSSVGDLVDEYSLLFDAYQSKILQSYLDTINSLKRAQEATRSEATKSSSFWTTFATAMGGGVVTDTTTNSEIDYKRQQLIDDYTKKIDSLQEAYELAKDSAEDFKKMVLGTKEWEHSEKGANELKNTLEEISEVMETIRNAKTDANAEDIEELLSYYNMFYSAILAQYEKFAETDFVITEYYDKQLAALKEQKELEDELAKQKEEQQKIADAELKVQESALEVEKARAALAEAREKKIKVFRMGKGMVYEEDTAAISSAQDDLSKSLDGYQEAMENLAKVQGSQTEKLISAIEKLKKAYGYAMLDNADVRSFFQTESNREAYQQLSEEEQLAFLMSFMSEENKAKASALWGLDEGEITKLGEKIREQVFGLGTGGAELAGGYLATKATEQEVGTAPTTESTRFNENVVIPPSNHSGTELSFKEKRLGRYHSGGIVGEKAFSSDSEMYAKLLKGEIVLPQGKFSQIIDRVQQSGNSESTILNIGNISLPNVDDADSFVRELQRISFAR